MTIRHIRIFMEVCSCQCNLTRAAEQMYMSQPAVTLAIKEIEQQYGVRLFDRLGKRLYLTEAGKQLQSYAMRIGALFDDMEKGMKNWDALGVLRIGSSITVGSQFMPDYVSVFSQLYPDTDVRVQIGTSDMIERKLLENKLDFALVETPVHQEHLVSEAYMEDALAVIAPARMPFHENQVLSTEEFVRQRLLLRELGSGTREVFNQVMERHDLHVAPVWEAMSTTALVNAVIHGLGIAVVPRRMVSGVVEQGQVYELKVDGLEFCRCFYIVYHRDKLLTKSMEAFISLCRYYELDYPLPRYSGLSTAG
ncbi:LysR family transcriptional regulator [Clostridium sp. AN503]|uniref:LysR family transcriptional regulator n=1 Tax=Clostridium sp. AN503 TaxID=3160598 RepID=UPI00345B480E